MGKSLVWLLVFFVTPSFANTICSGQVIVEDEWFPKPMVREIIVELNRCEQALGRNKDARVNIEIVGGGQMQYRGLVFTDGRRDHKIMVPRSGDITNFRVTSLPGDQIIFELTMYSSKMERLGGIQPTTLQCE